jgi:hypothetical protein
MGTRLFSFGLVDPDIDQAAPLFEDPEIQVNPEYLSMHGGDPSVHFEGH